MSFIDLIDIERILYGQSEASSYPIRKEKPKNVNAVTAQINADMCFAASAFVSVFQKCPEMFAATNSELA